MGPLIISHLRQRVVSGYFICILLESFILFPPSVLFMDWDFSIGESSDYFRYMEGLVESQLALKGRNMLLIPILIPTHSHIGVLQGMSGLAKIGFQTAAHGTLGGSMSALTGGSFESGFLRGA